MPQSSNALPSFFTEMLDAQYCAEDVARIVAGCSTARKTSLRANTLKATHQEVAAALDEAGITWSPVTWYEDAFVLENATPRDLWELPVYKEGNIYLQSLSSMLPPLVLGAAANLDILDMCAAPGGKTTQLAALGGKECHITACEMHAPRAEKLRYNLEKQGAGNVTVMHCDARRLDEFFRFDRILLDAPCSGSGTLRAEDPKLSKRFTTQLVQKSCKAQAALLSRALCLLKPGSTLVYSTCSVLACENEDIVRAALKRANGSKRSDAAFELQSVELEAVPDGSKANALQPHATFGALPAHATPDTLPLLPTTLEGALCVCPTDLYEGFFVAKIKRTR